VNGVPDRIDPRNFIGEKFEKIESASNCDDPWVPEDLQRLILWRQSDPVKMNCQASDENREIKVDAGKRGKPQRDRKQVKFFHAEIIQCRYKVKRVTTLQRRRFNVVTFVTF